MEQFVVLENLITEFYSPNASNDRRREIENTLVNFENEVDSWKYCLQYLATSSNTLVCSFCSKIMENLICKHWVKLADHDRILIQSTLHGYVFSIENNIPSLIRKHLMKLIAKIERNGYPQTCSALINDIPHMIMSDDTNIVLQGLSYLYIAIEEFINPQEDLNATRKLEIRNYIQTYISQITYLLNGAFQKHKNSDCQSNICENILNLYSQLFSCIPLSGFYTAEILLPVFDSFAQDNPRLRILALTALNELLYKNYVPNDCVPLIVNSFLKVNDTLNCLTNVPCVDEDLLSKILETISLIFSSHWHRIESNVEGNVILSFLSSFYTLSFRQVSSQLYGTCLEIWCSFLEYVTMRNSSHVKEYEMILSTLLQEMITKLHKISTFAGQEESEEHNNFFNQHMNIIELLSELLRNNAFSVIWESWSTGKELFVRLLFHEESALSNESTLVQNLHEFETSTRILTSLRSKIEGNLNVVLMQTIAETVITANKKFLEFDGNINSKHRALLKAQCQLVKMIPIWICLSAGKDNNVIVNVFTSILPFVVECKKPYPRELQIVSAYAIGQIIEHVNEILLLQPLFADLTFKHLPVEGQTSLQCALCCWVCNSKKENYNDRLNFLKNLLEAATQMKIENVPKLTEMIHFCRINKSEGKDMLFEALKPWVERVLEQYPENFSNNNQLFEIESNFLFEIFRVLQDHVTREIIQKILVVCDECYVRYFNCSAENENIDYIVQLLITLVENLTHKYKEYISSVLSVVQKVFSQINVTGRATSHLSGLHQLLRCLLLNSTQNRSDTEIGILLAYILDSFSRSDFDIFKDNLRCLEETNSKWNLYCKESFRVKYMSSVLNVFLNILIDNSFLLLAEDIMTSIYHMASVDFNIFFGNYMPSFLETIPGLTLHQRHMLNNGLQLQTDMPSFVQVLNTFITDVRSYQHENGCR